MAMSPTLEASVMSAEELRHLTGYRQASAMCRWLQLHHWNFEPPKLKGELPRVARAYFHQRLVTGDITLVEQRGRVEPNFSFMTGGSRNH
jgi:hypothetical protein